MSWVWVCLSCSQNLKQHHYQRTFGESGLHNGVPYNIDSGQRTYFTTKAVDQWAQEHALQPFCHTTHCTIQNQISPAVVSWDAAGVLVHERHPGRMGVILQIGLIPKPIDIIWFHVISRWMSRKKKKVWGKNVCFSTGLGSDFLEELSLREDASKKMVISSH